MARFDYLRSIAILESKLSLAGFEKIRVALSLLHYDYNLELSERTYLLALLMVVHKMEKSSLPRDVARNYGFDGPRGDYDIVQAEIYKGIQHIPRRELEAEMAKISKTSENEP